MKVKKLIKNILKESDFDWADIDPSTLHRPYIGMKFSTKNDPNSVYEIFDLSGSIVYYKYVSVETGLEVKTSIPIIYFKRYMQDGDWVPKYIKENFDWTAQADETPNYQGHPQGVVYLRNHDEITEFFNLLGTYGVGGKHITDVETTKKNFQQGLEDVRDYYERDSRDYLNACISASFFISKVDPTKYDTGYWGYDVDRIGVQEWLDDTGCKDEVIDCENWKLYTDISEIRGLFKDYTGEVLHKTKSGEPIKVGDKVKVIDPSSEWYGEVLEVEHLVGGDGYEKHGGAFQTIEHDTTYFAGYEVEHVEDVNENFDWTDNVSPETEWDKDKYYVLDITSLSGLKLHETVDDIWDFAYNMDYDVEVGVQYDNVGYIYFEPNDDVPEGYAIDWSPRKTTDPTFDGKYQMLTLDEFYHMAYGDEPNINEDFDWVSNIQPDVVQLLKSKLKGSEFHVEVIGGDIIEINDSNGGTYVDGYLDDKDVYMEIINSVKEDSEHCDSCPPGVQDEYKRLYDLIKDNINEDFDWAESTPEYVDVNSLEVGDHVEVIVLDNPNNMFNGKKGTVVLKGGGYEGDNPYASIDWDKGDFNPGRTLFSVDIRMNAQYRFLKEDFDWAESVPNPGRYNLEDLETLILSGSIKNGDRIHLKGHAKDINRVFDDVGTIIDYTQYVSKYLDSNDEDEAFGISIEFDDENVLSGLGYNGTELEWYEIRSDFADQEDLTFDLLY